jgi:hypothetical protein
MQLHTNNSEDLTAREIFRINMEFMRGAYPNRNIELRHTDHGDIVVMDGKDIFNIEGHCLLHNLQRLCECLESELR